MTLLMNLTDVRYDLCKSLQRYTERVDAHLSAAVQILEFVKGHPDCFERTQAKGHITASALLLHPSEPACLLTFHRKLQRWLQPGGHADGDSNTLAVAVREAEEESGILGIEIVDAEIFDVDVHLIPARPQQGEPEHYHYDVRYLLRAPHDQMLCSEESEALAWMSWDEIEQRAELFDEAFLRMRRLYLARRMSLM